jgi:adenylate cyclase
MVCAGEAEKAIEWCERALRLSPFDPMVYGTLHSIALGRFQLGKYELAAEAAHKIVRANPYWSLGHVALAQRRKGLAD